MRLYVYNMCVYVYIYIYIYIYTRPVPLLRVWVSKGLTQADSEFLGLGIPMSVEFDRGSPGKFDSRTLNRNTLNRWTGRTGIFQGLISRASPWF